MATNKRLAAITSRELERFFGDTAFKVLQFIRHSTHWTESVLWIALLIGATTLAIRDVRKVCEEYASEKTYTSMRVVGVEKLTFDNATVCVEFDPRALNISASQLAQHTDDADVLEFARLANMTAPELMVKSLRLLTVFNLIESGRSRDYRRKVAELQHLDEDLQQLHDWLKMKHISMPDLTRTVGNWLCNSVGVVIEITKRGTLQSTANACDRAKISWLGVIPFLSTAGSEVAFCLDIGGRISFESMLERVILNVNANDLFRISTDYMADYGNYNLESSVEFSGDPVVTDMTNDFVMFPIRGCSAFRIGIDAEFHLVNRRGAHCDPLAKSLLACYGACESHRYDAEMEACNCVHLAWQHFNTGNRSVCFDVHTIQEQLDCRLAGKTTNVSEVCWQSCLYPCKQRHLALTAIAEGCYEADGRSGVSLEFMPKRFSVPVFEEQFAVGVSELFSRIGGTCGLWLGVGMFGVCHALLFPLKLLGSLFWQSALKQGDTVAGIELNHHA